MLKHIKEYRWEIFATVIGIILINIMVAVGALWYDDYKEKIYINQDVAVTTFRSSVSVPDFVRGENPFVIYKPTVLRDFIGDFRVEVTDRHTLDVMCHGSESGIKYRIGKTPPPEVAKFDWYVGRTVSGIACSQTLKPGEYFLKTTYTINNPAYPDIYYITDSNFFTIKERQ